MMAIRKRAEHDETIHLRIPTSQLCVLAAFVFVTLLGAWVTLDRLGIEVRRVSDAILKIDKAHDERLKTHDVSLEAHDERLDSHDVSLEVQGQRLDDHDRRLDARGATINTLEGQ